MREKAISREQKCMSWNQGEVGANEENDMVIKYQSLDSLFWHD